MRLYRTLVAAALGAVMTVSGAIAATPQNTLVIADAIDDIITLDPAEVSEVGGVLASQQIYQPLVSFDPADPTKITGVLAESWEVSEDGKVFTFKMNPNAKFASGNPVTARDAEYSLRRVILIDSRGHGHSTRDTQPYSYELMASDVLAVMDALHIEKAALIGWSDGACTALVLASEFPERAAGVFFFACNMDPSGTKEIKFTSTIKRCFSRHVKDYQRLSSTPDKFDEFAEAVYARMGG